MPYPYWSLRTKISVLQRHIIIHSITYYYLDNSTISDKKFDELSKELVQLMEQASEEELETTDYWYCMYDFDGSTGFYLYDRLTKYDKQYLTKIAQYVLSLKGRSHE